ncbi:hypothetical protein E2I00_004790, partial [Balaenoptera physalus]
MGSKKKETALQVNISTQELWEEMLSSKGLTGADVSTAGPNGFLINAVALVRDVGVSLATLYYSRDYKALLMVPGLNHAVHVLSQSLHNFLSRPQPPLSHNVVDVYQGWCGPCKPVVSLFQKMRIEVGLDLLHFALAEADCLDVLEKYRGRCEPTFLFYAGGELVALVRGANAPLLQKTIREQLQDEERVLAEGRERRVIKDEALSDEDECFSHEKEDGDDEDAVSSEKACTLAVIKPDAVVHGKTDEIIMKIQEAGFDILTNEERTMTEAEMRLFYQHRAGEEAFEQLVHHMCSGPSRLLILTRTEGTEDVVTAWQTLMGPCDPDVARREQPDRKLRALLEVQPRTVGNTEGSPMAMKLPLCHTLGESLASLFLRAQYGTEMPFNAVHGSRDSEDARRELALLFPSLEAEGEGPSEALCSPEDVDEAAHD